MKGDPFETLGQHRLVPVVTIDDAEQALPLADALQEGGLPCAEITFRTEAAPVAMKKIRGDRDFLLAAGTILTIDQVREARDAGADLMVSPGFDPQVVRFCIENEIPILPGVCTPTDVQAAFTHGLRVLKFFPSEPFGGLGAIQPIHAAFPMMKFVPLGGITPDNLESYLRNPAVQACGGTWMVKRDWIRDGQFSQITSRVRDAVRVVQSVEKSAV